MKPDERNTTRVALCAPTRRWCAAHGAGADGLAILATKTASHFGGQGGISDTGPDRSHNATHQFARFAVPPNGLGVTGAPLCCQRPVNGFQRVRTRILALLRLVDPVVLVFIPLTIDVCRSQVEHGLCALNGPSHARTFHPILHDVTTCAFDNAARNWVARCKIPVVLHAAAVLRQKIAEHTQFVGLVTTESPFRTRSSVYSPKMD